MSQHKVYMKDPAGRAVDMMKHDAMAAVLRTTVTIMRDIGTNRVQLEMTGTSFTWKVNDRECTENEVLQLIRKGGFIIV